MPFKSKAQQRFMFAKHPRMAKEWADKTPDIKSLPEKVDKDNEKTACIAPGIFVKSAEVPVDPTLYTPQNAAAMAMLNLGAFGGGTGLGYGLAKLTSPTNMSIDNLQREEMITRYNTAIDDLKNRIALKKLRTLKS